MAGFRPNGRMLPSPVAFPIPSEGEPPALVRSPRWFEECARHPSFTQFTSQESRGKFAARARDHAPNRRVDLFHSRQRLVEARHANTVAAS
jgi:hypothetical protein